MDNIEKAIFISLGVLVIPLSVGLYCFFQVQESNKILTIIDQKTNVKIGANSIASLVNNEAIKKEEVVPVVVEPNPKLTNPPQIIKAVYVTGWSAGSPRYLKYLNNVFETTEINAVVIDIKDYSGQVFYNSDVPQVKEYKTSVNAIPDINSLINYFHNKGIYVIGRIVVFEDPALAKARPDLAIYNKEETKDVKSPVLWLDNHGLPWLDPSSKEVWGYNISIAKDAFFHGFDEINFDYIRFPSDGKVANMGFPAWDYKTSRRAVIKSFFQELRRSLVNEKISADIFGYATVTPDDMGIGQVLEDFFEYFDYISPMVYPSHYSVNFLGYPNPAEYPYEVVSYSMREAQKRQTKYYNKIQSTIEGKQNQLAPMVKSKFRPWLQDFNLGAVYTEEMVKGQIDATKEVLLDNFNGYMVWNPSNVYTLGAIVDPTKE